MWVKVYIANQEPGQSEFKPKKPSINMNEKAVTEKLVELEKEIEELKTMVAKGREQPPKSLTSLKGLLAGVEITEADFSETIQ